MASFVAGEEGVEKVFRQSKSVLPQRVMAMMVLGIFSSSGLAADDVLETIEVRDAREQANERLALDRRTSTASRLGLSVRETPGSVSVIDRTTIEARGAADTQQILRGIPGVSAAAPPGQAGFVSYRGFSASQVTQLFNGVTVQYDAVSARPVDSWIYERVEAIGGASGFMYGAGAVGGVINYLTKQADRDDDLAQFYGVFGSPRSATLAAGFNKSLTHEDEPGVRHYARVDLSRSSSAGSADGEKRRALTAALSLLTDVSAHLSHTLAYEYQHEHVDRPYWGTPLLNPVSGSGRIDPDNRFRNYNARDGVYAQTVEWLRSVSDYRWSARTSFRNTFYHYHALRDFRNVEAYRYNADNTRVLRSSALLQRHAQQLSGNRFEWRHEGTPGPFKAEWAGGIDYSVNRMQRYPHLVAGQIDSIDPASSDTQAFFTIPGMRPGFVPDRANRVTTLAVFLENRTRVLPAISLVTGLRHDRIDLAVDNLRAASAANPAHFHRRYHPTTMRGALVWDVSPEANLFLQYSTAADPPAGALTTASFGQVRDFKLSTGKQIEAGSKFDFLDGRGNATISAYAITRNNLAVADAVNPGFTVPVGRQSSRGVELAFGLRPYQKLRLQGNLSLVRAQYDRFDENVGSVTMSRDGNRPANTPARVANLWLDYVFKPNWSAGIDVLTVSPVFGNAANTVTAPGYAIVGANLRTTLRNVTVTARIKNLTDKIYAAHLTDTPMFYLGTPRTVELAVLVNF